MISFILENYIWIVFWLSLGGVLFAAYMVAHKAILEVCPFNEECPYFLGYPACYFGLAMFVIMFMAACANIWFGFNFYWTHKVMTIVSILGIVFAGSYVVGDMREWLVNGRKYGLVLPTCAYGLIFYGLILIVSLI